MTEAKLGVKTTYSAANSVIFIFKKTTSNSI